MFITEMVLSGETARARNNEMYCKGFRSEAERIGKDLVILSAMPWIAMELHYNHNTGTVRVEFCHLDHIVNGTAATTKPHFTKVFDTWNEGIFLDVLDILEWDAMGALTFETGDMNAEQTRSTKSSKRAH